MLRVKGGQGRRARDIVDTYKILNWTCLLALNALAWIAIGIAIGAWLFG